MPIPVQLEVSCAREVWLPRVYVPVCLCVRCPGTCPGKRSYTQRHHHPRRLATVRLHQLQFQLARVALCCRHLSKNRKGLGGTGLCGRQHPDATRAASSLCWKHRRSAQSCAFQLLNLDFVPVIVVRDARTCTDAYTHIGTHTQTDTLRRRIG